MKTSSLGFIAFALFAGSAVAATPVATLESTKGNVLVNQGEEFVTAQPGVALASGDRVMVMVGAEAVVQFADGCALPLTGGSITTVPAASTCGGAMAQTEQVGQMYAQAVGGGSSSGSGGLATSTCVVGGLVVGFGDAVATTSNNPSNPISQ